MLCLIMKIHTEEKSYGKSIHTEEEPYIYNIIIVSLIKSPVYKTYPLSNPLVKISHSVHMATNLSQIQCLDHLCSFCSVKQMPIFINGQHLYFIWLCILGIHLRFLASLWHIEQPSMIPLTSLCYTLSWLRHQNVAVLVHLGCKWTDWSSCFLMFIGMIEYFFSNITQGMR